MTAELNRFIWPGFDLSPIHCDRADVFHWGFLPVELFDAVKAQVLLHQRAKRMGVVSRD